MLPRLGHFALKTVGCAHQILWLPGIDNKNQVRELHYTELGTLAVLVLAGSEEL